VPSWLCIPMPLIGVTSIRMDESMRYRISVVIPCLNEGPNVDLSYREIVNVFNLPSMSDYDLEIIFSDNHSEDDTFDRVKAIAAIDRRVRGIRYARNIGFQRSILTGFRICRGEAAIQIDCDQQDPAILIPEFLRHWREGYKVVYGVRSRRKEGLIDQLSRKIFYRLLANVSEDPLPLDAGDFRLIDRKIIDVLRNLKDLHPYIRGVISAIGFSQIGIAYERRARTSGKSKFNVRRNLALATDALVNHSMAPLRLATWVAGGLLVLMVGAGIVLVISRVWVDQDWPRGIALLAALQLFGIFMQAAFFGLLGEYVGRLYRQSKDQWPVVIEEQVGEDDH
jgi:glycosyltransferase involved in cell wall biosynthesis